MDLQTIIVIVVIVLLGAWLYNRFMGNRGPSTPTYDDKNTRSGGSIGGGPRTNDDPNIRSGGSIGGAQGMPSQRTNDDPNIRSGGSIGGSGVSSQERGSGFGTGSSSSRPSTSEPHNPFGNNASRASSPDIDDLRNRAGNTRPSTSSSPSRPSSPSRGGNDDPNTRSGGSIGG